MKKIVLYLHDSTLAEMYRKIAGENGVQVHLISDDNLEEKVEDIFLLESSHIGVCSAYQFDYLLFQNINQEELFSLIELFRASSLLFDGIKVAYTKTNATWKLKDLFAECEREYFLFMKLELLQEQMEQCNRLDFSKLSQEQKQRLQPDFALALRFLQQAEPDEALLDTLLIRLDTMISKLSQGDLNI